MCCCALCHYGLHGWCPRMFATSSLLCNTVSPGLRPCSATVCCRSSTLGASTFSLATSTSQHCTPPKCTSLTMFPTCILLHCIAALQIFKTWREYFQFSYLNESTLDPAKNYIFVEFPHGVFPMSELVAGVLQHFSLSSCFELQHSSSSSSSCSRTCTHQWSTAWSTARRLTHAGLLCQAVWPFLTSTQWRRAVYSA
jgi:hypothetical protein